MRFFESFRRSESGQAIVEVAVVTPFLFILLVSVIDIGRLYHYREIVGNSARAAAQYGAQGQTTVVDLPGMAAAGQNDAENWGATTPTPLVGLTVVGVPVCYCSNGNLTVCINPSICPTNTHMLTYASVTSSYTFKTLFNYHVIPTTFLIQRTEQLEVGQ